MAITLTWVNTGIDDREQVYLNKKTPFNLKVHLYKNNHAPALTDTPSAYTEPTAAGYAAVALVAANWTGSTSSGDAMYSYPTLTFTFTNNGGGETIYGVYLDDGGVTPRLQMAALLDTPFVIPSGGGSVTIALTDEFHQC